MFVYVQSFFIIALEVFCCKIFFETFGIKRKERDWLRNVGVLIFIIVLEYFGALFLSKYFLIKQIFMIFSIAFLMITYLKIKLWKAIILSALFQELLLVIDYFTLLIFHNLEGTTDNIRIRSALVVTFGKMLLFCVVVLVRKIMGKGSQMMPGDAEWLRFLFFPAFTICIIAALIQTSADITDLPQENMFFVIAGGLAGMNLFVFYLIHDITRRATEVREEQLYRLKVRNQVNMYMSISENFNKERKRTHEYKNQLMCIKTLCNKKDYDALEEFINNISGKFDIEMDYISTNNVIVDAILNTKYQEMKEQKIVFVFRINDLSTLSIADEDIVIILSNMLNNAVEACEKCKGDKVIKLKFVVEDDGTIIISVKNTFENALVYENGELQTTKLQTSEEHGIGIKNIIEVIMRYGGSYIIQNDSKEFYFSVFIPLKNMDCFNQK